MIRGAGPAPVLAVRRDEPARMVGDPGQVPDIRRS
jgi:hypothetical protein